MLAAFTVACAELASVCPLQAAQEVRPSDHDSKLSVDPNEVPTALWLPTPTSCPHAEASTEAQMRAYVEHLPGGVAFKMVPVPGGEFLMGSAADEAHHQPCEGPQVRVALDPFWISACEVTAGAYEQFAFRPYLQADDRSAAGTVHQRLADAITRPSPTYQAVTLAPAGPRGPVTAVTQLAAKMYCKWLSALTGRYYRLPTEAEWEYACRAGSTHAYCFGDDVRQLPDYAWYEANSDFSPHVCGMKRPNAWGLYDMHGNASEWVLDGFSAEGYHHWAGSLVRNPLFAPREIYRRVVRGGCYDDPASALRCAARGYSVPAWKERDPELPPSIWNFRDAPFVGFRVVRPLRLAPAEEAERFDLDTIQIEQLRDYRKRKGIR